MQNSNDPARRTMDQAAGVGRSTVFVSYSRKDRRFLEELKTQLTPFERAYNLDVWDDSRIPVGMPWKDAIGAALDRARVGVLLISPDFLASKFVAEVELPKLLAAARGGGLLPCIVHIRSSVVAHLAALGSLQAVNDPKQPISMLRGNRRDAAWASVAEIILKSMSASGARAPSPAAEALGAVSQKLELFAIRALNLRAAFQYVGDSAFSCEQDIEELGAAIVEYNGVLEDIQTRQSEYIHALGPHLPADLAEELREIFLFAIDDVHRTYVFALNDTRVRIQKLQRGQVDPGQVESFRNETKDTMHALLNRLGDKVPLLERRIKRFYARAMQGS